MRIRHIRMAVILSGSLMVSAIGGLIAAVPAVEASGIVVPAVERAPSPELEVQRRAVLASLRAVTDTAANRAVQLEILSDLMADASRHRDRALVEASLRETGIHR